jgi:hypothetical protein
MLQFPCDAVGSNVPGTYGTSHNLLFLHVINIFKELQQAFFSVQPPTHFRAAPYTFSCSPLHVSVQPLTRFRPLSVPDMYPDCMQC